MTTQELISLADKELDSRKLAQPSMRKNAVRRIVRFMESTGSFLNGKQVVLPSDKKVFEDRFSSYIRKKPYGAESGAINIIYQVASSCISNQIFNSLRIDKAASTPIPKTITPIDADNAEESLINGNFVPVNRMTNNSVKDVPGLYCIKLRKEIHLSQKFGKVREDGIIYIGKASKSLKKRLWEQELNHKSPATFFRSMGAILGYLPPKGSLHNQSTHNYKFSPEDTEAIKEWMRQSLLVNWISLNNKHIDNVEERLIGKYCPLVNIDKNPAPSEELKAARKRCIEYAKGE